MSNTKELVITLKNADKCYYPGDLIHGQININLKKSSVDVQHISVNLHGCIEGVSDRVTLLDETRLLATPAKNKKYTSLTPGKCHTYDFEFKIPTDQRLPSFAHIPRVAKITYSLTATHKKPKFKLSHTLSTATLEIKVLDMINVLLPDYRLPVKMSQDLGFINGSRLSQWCISLTKSAFTRGEDIKLECQINNFPLMDKLKAAKVSLTRQVYKTSSAKMLENKVLSTKSIDICTKDSSPSQTIPVRLHIPSETPPSVFPDSGRVMNVSYVVQVELKMKGVKSAIKLKSVYQQEIAIVIGTFPIDNVSPSYHDNNKNNRTASQISLHTLSSTQSSKPTYRSSATDLLSTARMNNTSPPPSPQCQMPFSEFDNIKPLPRLEELAKKHSYINNNNSNTSSSSLSVYSPTCSTPSSPQSPTPSFRHISSYQQEFDDYIPTTRSQNLSFSSSRLSGASSAAASTIDRSLTPLPSMKSTQPNPYSTISYLNRRNTPRSSQLSATVVQTPHEIGPDDIITTKQAEDRNCVVDKPHTEDESYFNVKTLQNEEDEEDNDGARTPGLLSRHDTISTASSGGLVDPSQPFSPGSAYPTPLMLTRVDELT